ncbi:MAG TPA: YbaB/EbfC family nucleoid-associated protein [Acidimicrobiales bacterium]|nr:YbaB/EbfC family nucleoid-associated protein [Acidimicrobiales bacterium]
MPFSDNLLCEMATIQREIDATRTPRQEQDVVGSTPDGAIRVRSREDDVFSAFYFDPVVLNGASSSELEQLVLTALNNAGERLEERRRERIGAAIQAMLDDCLARGNRPDYGD